jgi:hypothetical protein
MSRSFVGAWAPWPRCRQQRAVCGSGFVLALMCILAAATAQASSDPPTPPAYLNRVDAVATDATMPLTMEEAARLAAVDQPLLTGRQAKIQAEEQQAVAAAQLPDPQLTGGLKELPIDTPEAFSTRRDASLAWLDLYETEQGLKLTQRLADEATLQVQLLENDYSNGKASQADWFAAKTAAGLAADEAHDWLHHELRNQMGLTLC